MLPGSSDLRPHSAFRNRLCDLCGFASRSWRSEALRRKRRKITVPNSEHLRNPLLPAILENLRRGFCNEKAFDCLALLHIHHSCVSPAPLPFRRPHLVGLHQSHRRRQDGRSRYRQPRRACRPGVCRRTTKEGWPRTGRHQRLLPAGPLRFSTNRRERLQPDPRPQRPARTARARRRRLSATD